MPHHCEDVLQGGPLLGMMQWLFGLMKRLGVLLMQCIAHSFVMLQASKYTVWLVWHKLSDNDLK